MGNLEKSSLNLEPLYEFFTDEILPKDFARLLDEFLYNYVIMLVQSHRDDRIGIHKDTTEFIYYLKSLREIIPLCVKEE